MMPQRRLRRMRSAVAKVDPALLNASDVGALIDLIQAAVRSDSELGRAVRKHDEAIEARNAARAATPPNADVSRDW